jgi:malic enzyme
MDEIDKVFACGLLIGAALVIAAAQAIAERARRRSASTPHDELMPEPSAALAAIQEEMTRREWESWLDTYRERRSPARRSLRVADVWN